MSSGRTGTGVVVVVVVVHMYPTRRAPLGAARGARHHVCMLKTSAVDCCFLGFEESRTVHEKTTVHCASFECEYFYCLERYLYFLKFYSM